MHPAHSLDDDAFRQTFALEQRELVIRVYRTLEVIRLVLSRHPRGAGIELHPYIRDGKIWTL
jgi:hypothetical protein